MKQKSREEKAKTREEKYREKVSQVASANLHLVRQVLKNEPESPAILTALRRHAMAYASADAMADTATDGLAIGVVIGLVLTFLLIGVSLDSLEFKSGWIDLVMKLLAFVAATFLWLYSAFRLVNASDSFARFGFANANLIVTAGMGIAGLGPQGLIWGHKWVAANPGLRGISVGLFGSSIFLMAMWSLALLIRAGESVVRERVTAKQPAAHLIWSLGMALHLTDVDADVWPDFDNRDWEVKHNLLSLSLAYSSYSLAEERFLREEALTEEEKARTATICQELGIEDTDYKSELVNARQKFIDEVQKANKEFAEILDVAKYAITENPSIYARVAKPALHVDVENALRDLIEKNQLLLTSWRLSRDAGNPNSEMWTKDLAAALDKWPEHFKNVETVFKAAGEKLLQPMTGREDVDLRFQQPNMRNSIAGHLERAARALEMMSVQLSAGDAANRMWADRAYAERAAAIRQLKQWVLLPLGITRAELSVKLRALLFKLANGDFGSLDRADVPAVPRTFWLARAGEWSIPIVVVALPALVVYGLKTFKLPVPDVILQWWLPVSLLIAVVKVFFLLDPHFGEQIRTSKDFIDLFGGREKKDAGSSH